MYSVYLVFSLDKDRPTKERLLVLAVLVVVSTQLGQELHEERTV